MINLCGSVLNKPVQSSPRNATALYRSNFKGVESLEDRPKTADAKWRVTSDSRWRWGGRGGGGGAGGRVTELKQLFIRNSS